ncbi:MAG: hypothetical protein KC983_11770 [Phycisphaerales bacterium]|nr:hypothetical protein [Phycisphaerales bacterium]
MLDRSVYIPLEAARQDLTPAEFRAAELRRSNEDEARSHDMPPSESDGATKAA